MAKKHIRVEKTELSREWPEFMHRLAEAVGGLKEDQYLVINVKQTNRFVQFAGQGSYGLRAETTSNRYLDKAERLGRKKIAALRAMGWQSPTGKPKKSTPRKDPDGSPNFFTQFEAPVQSDTVAQMAVETLVSVLGVSHPGMLEYEAFDSAGSKLEFHQLGLKVTDHDHLRSGKDEHQLADKLLKTISAVTGISDLQYDSDGDITIRCGSMLVCVCLIQSPAMVHIFTPLIHEVDESPALLSKLNELNRGSYDIRYCFNEGVVIAEVDVRTEPYVDAHVADAYRSFCKIADDVDDLLQLDFGGKRMFDDWQPSSARH